MKADEVYSKLKKMISLVSTGIKNTTSTQNPDGSVTITINFTSGSPLSFTMSPVKGDKGVGIKDALIKEIQNEEDKEYHLILIDDEDNNIDAGKLPISSGGAIDLSNYTTKDNSIKSINLVEAIPTGSTSTNAVKCLQLIFADDTKIINVSCEDLVDSYDDTQVKSDINDLKLDKQNKTDNSLETTDKTVVGAINAINGNQLDNVTFSSDYKNIILNRKNGLNPYVIPIASIINNAKLIELNDVDTADIGDGKTLIYDAATQKHKYVDTTGTDEFVKMDNTADPKYLAELIDKSTIVNDNGTLKVKKLDGQEVSIEEINHLKGLTMNVMDLVKMFSNGGVKILNTPMNTYADLLVYDKTGLIDGISYLVYVLADETHDNAKTTYLIDKTSSTPTYFGFAGEHRDFTTNPIDLANEVTGKLGASNIDADALWNLLTINDTYKTLTTKNEVFGTHGAKALYDELVASIGKKANTTDLTTHTSDNDIHITTAERTKWNEVDNKVDKVNIVTIIDENSTDTQVPTARAVYNNINKDNNIKTYTSIEQLGLTAPTTVGDIYNSLPNNSCLNIVASHPSIKGVPSFSPTQSGLLSITKINTDAYNIIFKPNGNGILVDNIMYIGQLKGTDGSNLKWERLCTWDDTDIHITNDERTKWNKVDNKVDKTDITTTINSSSTDTQVPSARVVYDNSLTKGIGEGNTIIPDGADLNDYLTPGVYTCFSSVSAETLSNCPHKESNFKLFVNKNTGEETGFYGYQMIVGSKFSIIFKPCVYYRSIGGDKANLTYSKWQRLCSTSVADVPVTDIVPADTTTFVNFAGNCNYCVKNGICYVTIWGVKITSAGGSKQAGVYLPKSANGRVGAIMAGVGDGMCHAFAYILEDGNLFFDVKDANINLYASFSYPVSES